MLAHCRARQIANTASQNVTVPSHQVPLATQANIPTSSRTNAALAQARGSTHFTGLSMIRRTVSLPSALRSSSNTPVLTTPTTQSMPLTPILPNLTALPVPVAIPPTKAEKAAVEAEEYAHDLRTVRNELSRYKEEPLFAESAKLDLVRYWDVRSAKCLLEYKLNPCNRDRNQKLLIHLAIK
jgi:hypothetical protein